MTYFPNRCILSKYKENPNNLVPKYSSQFALSIGMQFNRGYQRKYKWADSSSYTPPSFIFFNSYFFLKFHKCIRPKQKKEKRNKSCEGSRSGKKGRMIIHHYLMRYHSRKETSLTIM